MRFRLGSHQGDSDHEGECSMLRELLMKHSNGLCAQACACRWTLPMGNAFLVSGVYSAECVMSC